MKPRLRIVLPLAIGVLSVPLILWDIHNARVIESMGMAWDIGAPIWPYQTADILLRMINAPAYSITMPLATLLRIAAPTHLLLVIPAILGSWWFLGFTLDRDLTRWSLLAMLVVLVALLLWAVTDSPRIFRVRLDLRAVPASTTLLALRFLTPLAWFVALTLLLGVKAKRLVSGS